MNRVERGGLTMLVFPLLEEAGLTCAVSTRPLDVRDPEQMRRFVAANGLDPDRTVSPVQVHMSEVARIRESLPTERPHVDALVTDVAGQPLFVRAADCSLLIVADPVLRAVGVAHAGWRGSARGVVVNLLKAMHVEFGSRPAQLLAGVGPTISALHYEVGPEVPAAFLKSRAWTNDYVRVSEGALHFDLPGANARFLAECGIPPEHIDVCPYCTYGTPELLHSFRRDGTGGGHHGLVAAWPA